MHHICIYIPLPKTPCCILCALLSGVAAKREDPYMYSLMTVLKLTQETKSERTATRLLV